MEANKNKKTHYIVINTKTRTIHGYPYLDYQIASSVAKRLGPDWIVETK